MQIYLKQRIGGLFVDFYENSILGTTPPPPPNEGCHGVGGELAARGRGKLSHNLWGI
jgi:hypothetical protein